MNSSSQKILVTGVAGFLGSHLAEKLSEMNHQVIGVDNMTGGYPDNVPKAIKFHNFDCCDLNKMNEVMKGVDVVYHCAATAHEGLSVFSPVEITKNNFLASVSVFTAAVSEKVKRIIKKGWPGKIESVLDRQTDLVVLSFYGLYEYCARTKKKDRKVIIEDFINMLNLHLQDRLFF